MLSPDEARLVGVESRWSDDSSDWLESLYDTSYEDQKRAVLEADDRDWRWQRPYLEWVLENDQTITLKGRQLGVTWVWSLLALWYLLFRPGADVLVYSIKEEDAEEVVNRIWDMWLSLPEHFTEGIKVLKPTRGTRPSTRIELEHPDGRVSTITGMPATKSAGHSRSAALVIFDEASRQEYARELWKAVIPATGDKGGKIGAVSTANGMSDGKGLGNFFHDVWVGAGYASYPGVQKLFLGWWLHPDRDEVWYEHVPLDESSKAEQYPNDPDEAFLLSGSPYFDSAALRWYAQNVAKPLFKCEFDVSPSNPTEARLRKSKEGPIEVYRLPEPGHKYAIGSDQATGSGADFSCAAVIDLSDGTPVAELHMKADYKAYTTQLHYLGLWFNKARIAPETQGGYGDTVIAYLRDGLDGRKPYPFLYNHSPYDKASAPITEKIGFPMNKVTRPKVVSELRIWVHDHLLPWVTPGFLSEARTFVNRDTAPSPRAADGCNDDRIIAWGIVLELYARYGEHEHDRKKKLREGLKQRSKTYTYPWKYD